MVVIHGTEATGKSSIIRDYLSLQNLPHAIIPSRECITGRHLLERTVSDSVEAIEREHAVTIDKTPYAKTENLNALVTNMRRLLKPYEKILLVFDGIDQQAEAPPTLLPGLARLHEFVSLEMLTILPNKI